MRDNFNKQTRDIVAERTGGHCSNPDCRAATSGPQLNPAKALSLGVAAHITAAAPGGPRYDQTLTTDQRRSIENAIWLCQNCAKLIDNDPERFTVYVLREWKVEAERLASVAIGKTAEPGSPAAVEVRELLKKLSPEVSAEFFLREGYEALTAADPSLSYTVSVEEGGISTTVRSRNGEPISFAFMPVFPDTSEGQQKAQEFAEFLATGTPVELDETNIPVDDLPEPLRRALRERGQEVPFRLRLGPRRPRVFTMSVRFVNEDGDESLSRTSSSRPTGSKATSWFCRTRSKDFHSS